MGVDPLDTGVNVVLYTAVQAAAGRTDARGKHLSDFLNERDTAFLSLSDAALYDVLDESEPPATTVRLTLRKDAVQLAVLSDSLDLLRPRIPTQIVRIQVATSFFRVDGSLHRTPRDSSNLELFLSGHSRRFLAVSNARIRCLPNPRFDRDATTVLVNTEHVLCWWL